MTYLALAGWAGTLVLAPSLSAASPLSLTTQGASINTLAPAQRCGVGQPNSFARELATIDWDGMAPRETVVAAGGDGIRIHRMGLTTAGSTLVPTDPHPFDVLVLDLDGDGHEDLLWSSESPTTAISWARRIPGAEFETPIVLSSLPGFGAGTSVRGLATGDINGDGLLDIAFGTTGGTAVDRGVHYLLGAPGPGFSTETAPVTVESGTRCYTVACVDMDDDGHLDLVAESGGDLAIFYGDGQLAPAWFKQSIQTAAPGVRDICTEDLDGNGLLDIALATSGANQGTDPAFVLTALQVTPRIFPASYLTTHATGLLYRSVVATDFNQDGDYDIAVTRSDLGELTLFPGTGQGMFGPAQVISSSLPEAYGSCLSDWDGDGDQDLFVAHGKDCSVIENVVGRSFATVELVPGFSGIDDLLTMDVNLDGVEDLVGRSGGQLWQSSLNPSGQLPPPSNFSPNWIDLSGSDLCAWDWDGDGADELVVIKGALLTWWEPSPMGLTLAGSYTLDPAAVGSLTWIGSVDRGESTLLSIDHAWSGSFTDFCGDSWNLQFRRRRSLSPAGVQSDWLYGAEAENTTGDSSNPPCFVWVYGTNAVISGTTGRQPSGTTLTMASSFSEPDIGAGSQSWGLYSFLSSPDGSWKWTTDENSELIPELILLGHGTAAFASNYFHQNDQGGQAGPGGIPRWAYDAQGGAVIGVPGHETVVMFWPGETRWHAACDPQGDPVQTYFPGGARVANFAAELVLGADLDFDGDDELLLVHNGDLYITFDTRPIEDCNGNGFHDPTEVHRGFTPDCDADGVPDSCQITADPSLDCDADGALDSCQIEVDPSLDWNGDGVLDSCAGGGFVYCTSNPNAIGQVGSLKPQGSPLIADDAFTLYGHNLPLSQPAMVIMSRSTNYVNPFGGGAGVLCLGAPIRRFNMAAGFPLQFTSPTGEFSLSPSIGQFPGPNAVLPGEVIHFQLWHREFDPATGVPRSNTTDGISVMFR